MKHFRGIKYIYTSSIDVFISLIVFNQKVVGYQNDLHILFNKYAQESLIKVCQVRAVTSCTFISGAYVVLTNRANLSQPHEALSNRRLLFNDIHLTATPSNKEKFNTYT